MNPLNGLSLSALLLQWPEASPAQKSELVSNWAKAPGETALLVAPIDENTLDRAVALLLQKPAASATRRLWFAALNPPDRQLPNAAFLLPGLEHLIAQSAKESAQTLSDPLRRYVAQESAARGAAVLETPAENKERPPQGMLAPFASAAGEAGTKEPKSEIDAARLLALLKRLRERLWRWKLFFETCENEEYEDKSVADLLRFCKESLFALDRLIGRYSG